MEIGDKNIDRNTEKKPLLLEIFDKRKKGMRRLETKILTEIREKTFAVGDISGI